MTLEELMVQANVLVSFVILVVAVILQWGPEKMRGVFHTLCPIGIGVVAVISISDAEVIYGLGFILVGFYMSYKYDFFKRHTVTKLIISTCIILTIVIIAGSLALGWAYGIGIIAFFIFLTSVILIGELDVIRAYSKKEAQVDKVLKDIEGRKLDLKKMGFTRREMEIGRLLIEVKGTDSDLAEMLGVSANTMRNHMKSMRMKVKVKNKQQLIDSIRWYYHAIDRKTQKI